MNRRVVVASASGLAVAAASIGTAFALPSRPTLHSWAFLFTAEQTAIHVYTSQAIFGDKDVDGSGKVIGTDSAQCHFTSKTSADCVVAASFKGGQVFGEFTEDYNTGKISGKVTGGNRTFKGASGTITGHSVNNTTTKVTVRFQTP